VSQVGDLRDHVRTQTLHEAETLVANTGRPNRACPLGFPLAHRVQGHAQYVGVETAAQALVGGNDNDAHALRLLTFNQLDQEGVAILGHVGGGKVCRQAANLLAVRTRGPHALLRLAHLGRGHHFHGLGDLAGVLDRLDLGANFLAAWHGALLKDQVPITPRSS